MRNCLERWRELFPRGRFAAESLFVMPDLGAALLRDSHQHLRLLMDGGDCTLAMLDPAGTVIDIAELSDPDAAERAPQHFSCFYTSDDIARGKPKEDLHIATRMGRFESAGARLRSDGSIFAANIVITAIHDKDGTLAGFGYVTRAISGAMHDGERLRRSQREVRESVAHLRAVVDTAVDGIILIDALGCVEMANPACERLFGYEPDEVLGLRVEALIPAWLGRSDHLIDETANVSDRGEVAGIRKDGSELVLELSIGETKLDGERSFVGIIHDIAKRKRTGAQLVQAQKMEAVGQLSGGLAHDFNNLLTVVIGNGDLLSAALKTKPDLRHLSEMIVAAGERGAELTQRLLAFSRRQALMPVTMDCNQHVDRMYQLLRRTLRADVKIELVVDPLLNAAYADPAQLDSAILNLALNAQDAMPAGGRITIATSNASLDERYRENHQDVKPGEYVLVSMTDDGEGMTPEVLAQVFEPFFTTKEVGKGSGLGLSMVYGFAKQSNGHVSVSSELGLGTVVRLYLPSRSSLTAGAVRAAPVVGEVGEGGSETVLLVEVDTSVRNYATTCLESLGYSVISTAGAKEALALLAQGAAPDLLFTDVTMPGGVDGWELAKRARGIRPELKVLLTSGYALEPLIARARESAATFVLGKPYRKSELADRLRETFDTAA